MNYRNILANTVFKFKAGTIWAKLCPNSIAEQHKMIMSLFDNSSKVQTKMSPNYAGFLLHHFYYSKMYKK